MSSLPGRRSDGGSIVSTRDNIDTLSAVFHCVSLMPPRRGLSAHLRTQDPDCLVDYPEYIGDGVCGE